MIDYFTANLFEALREKYYQILEDRELIGTDIWKEASIKLCALGDIVEDINNLSDPYLADPNCCDDENS